jgi:hypothetical protein
MEFRKICRKSMDKKRRMVMSNNALLNGVTTSVQPSAAVLTEFMRNGWTQEDIDRMLSDATWDPDGYSESPLEAYKGGAGYLFDWGHVIERHYAPIENTPIYGVTWNFCLDAMLSKAHRGGINLGELCDLCLDYLEDVYLASHRNELPWPVQPTEGGSMSCFELHRQSTERSDMAAQEEDAARRWIATTFLDEVLPGLLTYLEDELDCVSSGVEALQ